MPVDVTNYRFRCGFCGDLFENEDRDKAYNAALACEHQGIEVEPLPDGTPVLAVEWVNDGSSYRAKGHYEWHLREIVAHEVGSGRYQQGSGHQVAYQLDGDPKPNRRPSAIHPHLPGQLNHVVDSRRDRRSFGDRLQSRAFHDGESAAEVAEGAELLGRLLGQPVDLSWLAGALGASSSSPDALPLLPPRHELSTELRHALDLLARPPHPGELKLTSDYRDGVARDVRQGLNDVRGEYHKVRPDFPNAFSAAWTLALRNSGGKMAPALAWLVTWSEHLPSLLQAAAETWWDGEGVSMPMHLLIPIAGTKAGGMTAEQKKAVDALGDVQYEPHPGRYRYSSHEPEWRDGAMRVVAEPPVRSNQKVARYRPQDALAGIAGWHPEVQHVMTDHKSFRPDIPVIAVASGKGGVGKSTVAAALAQRLTAEGTQATVIDLDLQGPSLPALLDLPPANAVNGQIKPVRLADGSGAWSLGQVFAPGQQIVFSSAQIEALLRFLAGALDLSGDQILVVDLPPGTSDTQAMVESIWQPAGTVLVTTGSKVAHADLRRAADATSGTIVGLVENLTRVQAYTLDGQVAEARLYDGASTADLAAELDIPYLGSLPHAPELALLAASAELGTVAQAVAAVIARQPVAVSDADDED